MIVARCPKRMPSQRSGGRSYYYTSEGGSELLKGKKVTGKSRITNSISYLKKRVESKGTNSGIL